MKNFDVEYVADLARIKLTPDEIKTFESQLGQVLEHVAKLNEVDVSQVEPMAHSFPIYNVFREDEIARELGSRNRSLERAASGPGIVHRNESRGVNAVEITSLTVHEIQALIRSRQISPKEVIEALGRRIERSGSIDSRLFVV